MKAWWQALAQREQRMLLWGGGLSLLLLVYALLLDPLLQQRQAWRQRAQAAEQGLLWMQRASERLAGRPQPSAPNDGRSLLARVDSSARDAGLASVLLRVEPVNAAQVRAHFSSAPFDSLFDWLQGMQAQYGVQIDEFSIQRADGVGLVDARITLNSAP